LAIFTKSAQRPARVDSISRAYDSVVERDPDIALPPESRGEAPGRARMTGRRVVVVGAGQTDYQLANQPIGIGRAISVVLGREGARVVAVDSNALAAEETVELVRAEGAEATAVIADVADPQSIEAMIDRSLEWLGGIDGIAYNVGLPGATGFEANTAEAWDAVLAVNLRGAMLTARAALRVLERSSSLVFTSSIGSLRPTGQKLAYESSKAALGALMRAVAFEGKERSIRANIVMPGLIDTGLGRDSTRLMPARATIPVPLGRHGTGWEVAYAALFLLSSESAYITGQTLAVDGGRTTL
jgi:NAD(P)-dependent dehydrogenase (short-subunit alcohol dehydrogenase family)